MKQLEKNYRKNGYQFHLVEREHDIAIYEQCDIDTGKRVAFEVFEVVKIPEMKIMGRLIEAHEKTPSNEEWGSLGFTVWTFSAAKEKAELLLTKKDRRNLKPYDP